MRFELTYLLTVTMTNDLDRLIGGINPSGDVA